MGFARRLYRNLPFLREVLSELGTDRIGAVDENGDVIYGDMLLLIYGREILTAQAGRDVHRRSEVLASAV